MKKNRILTGMLLLMLITTVIMSAVSHGRVKSSNSLDTLGYSVDFSEGWYMLDASNKAVSPDISRIDFNKFNTDKLTLYHYIPTSTDNIQRTLALHTNNISIAVYVDNEKIYAHGEDLSLYPFSKAPGSTWHFVKIPAKTSGALICMEISRHFRDSIGGIPSVYFGESAVILKRLIAAYAPELFLCIILILIGISYCLMHILFNSAFHANTQLFYIGMFTTISALYSLMHLPTPIFFLGNNNVINVFERMLLMVMPFVLMLHIEKACPPIHKRLYYSGYIAVGANFLIEVLICVLTPISLHDMLYFTHAVILYSGALMLFDILECIKNPGDSSTEAASNKRLLLFGFIAFVVLSFMDIVSFYIVSVRDATRFLRIGLSILTLCSGIISFREINEYSRASAVSETVRRLAYTDQLTGLANRASFESEMDKIDSEKNEHKTIGIVVFDVNSLKYVNDNFGHQQGDILIKSAAEAIKAVFLDNFKTFRIGGDEFAAIYAGSETSSYINRKIELFKNQISRVNMDIPDHLHLSVAAGAAFMPSSCTESVTDVFRRADRSMYENKKEMKNMQ